MLADVSRWLVWCVALSAATLACGGSGDAETNTAQEPAEGEASARTGPAADASQTHTFDPEDRLGLVGEPVRGSPRAPITIVEWASFQCPFSAEAQPTLAALEKKYGDDVRIVFKQHPNKNQQSSAQAAEAALEAHAQGRFWAFHDKLMANQEALFRVDLERYAVELGLDPTQLIAALDDGRHKARVAKDLETAQTLGLRGTPNFLINGRTIVGAQSLEKFVEVIDAELVAMRTLVDGGRSVTEAYTERLAKNLAGEPLAPPPGPRPSQPDPAIEVFVPLGDSPTRGGKEPLVTLVTFASFQCPYCSKIRPTLAELEALYGEDVQLVFKHRPLDFQPQSTPAALAAIAAHHQGRFWPMHDKLFEHQSELSPERIRQIAVEIGLDMKRFDADLASPRTRARLQEDLDLAARLVVNGPPSTFINGYRLRGAQPIENFRSVIDRELAVARAELRAGTPRARLYDKLQEDAVRGTPPMFGDAASASGATFSRTDIPVGESVAIGARDAKVVLVEFSDYQCGFCARLASALAELRPSYQDRVLFVRKMLPRDRGTSSHVAAEAALAAHAQGRFAEFDHAVFAKRRDLDLATLLEIAADVGLDVPRFKADLEGGRFRAQVEQDVADAKRAGVTSSPTLFIAGGKLGSPLSAAGLRAQLDAALARTTEPAP